jgi:hypothetical protein
MKMKVTLIIVPVFALLFFAILTPSPLFALSSQQHQEKQSERANESIFKCIKIYLSNAQPIIA